jgi:hypothetical protein
MVVEHTFITTMEAPEALRAASEFLQASGFVAKADGAFQIDGSWPALEMSRGSVKLTRSGIRDWPQQVRVEWDRGKVEVAASVMPPRRGRSWNVSLTGTSDVRVSKRDDATMRDMLTKLATALELLLAQRSLDEAAAHWSEIELRLEAEAKARKRAARIRTWIILGIFFLFIAALVALVSSNWR